MQNYQEHPIMVKRLRQMLWVFLIGSVLGVLITWFNVEEHTLAKSFNTIIFALGIVVLGFAGYLFRRGKRQVATLIMLFSVMVEMIAVTWAAGGLYSIGLIIFPMLMLFAAAYVQPKYFIILSACLLTVTVFFGFNHIYHWVEAPQGLYVGGLARLLGFLSAFIVCSILVWFVSNDLRFAFKELDNEKRQMAKSNKVIQRLVDYDALTGLLSYKGALARFKSMQNQMVMGKEQIVFYFIDLDNFKLVNDVYDHSTGDELLALIGERLQAFAKESDTAACRVGGDEFILFKQARVNDDVTVLSERLLQCISEDVYPTSLVSLRISASVGVTLMNDKDTDFATVRKKADMAMIQAKQSGKNNFHSYSEALETAYMSNLMMVQGLKKAVSCGLLELDYQVKMSLVSGDVIGAGSRINWVKDNPHNYQFNDFWPVIKNTELIHEIGTWALKESCLAAKSWEKAGYPLLVSLKLSANQLARASFADSVLDALKEADLDPARLVLTVPENSFYEEEAEATELQINKLKAEGVKLSIAGFGNGYSNLAQITKLRIDGLCLDGNFISGFCDSDSTNVVVSAIIDVSNELGMVIGAEGIKTEAQATALANAGCRLGEGPYWAEPMSSDEFLQFVAERRKYLAIKAG
ncbi:EAL domain-containing protein [Leucothrix sargassi]|nr:EAL domain-containing protein [Leucothrix sargassi]